MLVKRTRVYCSDILLDKFSLFKFRDNGLIEERRLSSKIPVKYPVLSKGIKYYLNR